MPTTTGGGRPRLDGILLRSGPHGTASRAASSNSLTPPTGFAAGSLWPRSVPRCPDPTIAASGPSAASGRRVTLTQPLRILVPRPLALPVRTPRAQRAGGWPGSLLWFADPQPVDRRSPSNCVSQPVWKDGDQPVEGSCAGRPVPRNGARLPPPA